MQSDDARPIRTAPAGKHADADDTDPGRAGVIEQAPIILGRIVRRQLDGRDAVNRLVKRIGERAGFPFKVHVHMLRHACGYALANEGHDTRAIQDWLGHRAIQHTTRYTELSQERFKDFWRA